MNGSATHLLTSLLLLGSLGLTVAGCQTYEVTKHGGNTSVRHVNNEEDFEETPEGVLVMEAREKDDAKSWWKLGDYYERQRRWQDAISAYEVMQKRIQENTKQSGQDYVGGLYLLGKCHAMLRNWDPAIAYLRAVLEKQPKTFQGAFTNPYFRESHYLLGAIYFEHRMYEDARVHLETFKELSGGDVERRADHMLIKIEDAIGPPPPRSTPAGAKKPKDSKGAKTPKQGEKPKDAEAPKQGEAKDAPKTPEKATSSTKDAASGD